MLGIKALQISAEIPAVLPLFSKAVPKCSLFQLLAQLMQTPEGSCELGGSPLPSAQFSLQSEAEQTAFVRAVTLSN